MPLAAAIIIGTLFTSCKKEYVCECEFSLQGISQEMKFQLPKAAKRDAGAMCATYNTQYASSGAKCALE